MLPDLRKAPSPVLLASLGCGLLVAGGIAFSLLSPTSHAQSAPPGAPPLEVGIVTLHPKPFVVTTDLPGRASAFRTADVRPQVNGIIQKRLFTEGDEVTKGQQLYQIDPEPYLAALASAKATLAHATASATAAQLTADRYKSLVAVNAVSHQDYDNAVATLAQDQADVESATAAVHTAEINVQYTKVLSPLTGRTGRSSVTEGALVTANQAGALVTVIQLDPIYVDVTQPSTTLLRLRRELASGQIKAIGNNQAAVKLTLEDGTAYNHPGTLQFREVMVDQGTDSVVLRSLFPNPEGTLLPGMFVNEALEEGTQSNALLVPQQAVTHDPTGAAVAMVVGSDDKVAVRIITTDRAVGNQWLVTKGLAEGDRVIVEGLQKARPGTPVTTKEVSIATTSPTGG